MRVILRCVPLVLLSFLWIWSYQEPAAIEGGSSPGSAWTVFSTEGHLGCARVDLTGPAPQEVYGVTAQEALVDLLEDELEGAGPVTWLFRDKASGQTTVPGRPLDRIRKRFVRVGWAFLVLATLAGTLWSLWRRRRRRRRGVDPGVELARSA